VLEFGAHYRICEATVVWQAMMDVQWFRCGGAARTIWVVCLALFTAFQRVMGCAGPDDEYSRLVYS
jgi:hypothetical protein